MTTSLHVTTTRAARLAAALVATAAVAAPTAFAADKADIGKQTTAAKAGQRSPLAIPGTGLKQGAKLRAGQTLVTRTAAASEGAEGRTTLTCAAGSTLEGIAPKGIGAAVTSKGSYVGKRSVRVRVFSDGGDMEGALFALCAKA